MLAKESQWDHTGNQVREVFRDHRGGDWETSEKKDQWTDWHIAKRIISSDINSQRFKQRARSFGLVEDSFGQNRAGWEADKEAWWLEPKDKEIEWPAKGAQPESKSVVRDNEEAGIEMVEVQQDKVGVTPGEHVKPLHLHNKND